mgnify:CR=1 FL=1
MLLIFIRQLGRAGICARKKQSDQPENLMYNSYYQWVSIFLVFQAMLFYIPRVIWLMLEGGKNRNITVVNKLQFYPLKI